jgi:hypothetical protein
MVHNKQAHSCKKMLLGVLPNRKPLLHRLSANSPFQLALVSWAAKFLALALWAWHLPRL